MRNIKGTRLRHGSVLLAILLAGCAGRPQPRFGVTRAAVLHAELPVQVTGASPLAESAPKPRPDAPAMRVVTLPSVATAGGPRVAPEATVVAVGQEVCFVNRDAICHSLFSSSAPNAFQLGPLQPNDRVVVRFDHPGLVSVYCALHQHRHLLIRVEPEPAPLPR